MSNPFHEIGSGLEIPDVEGIYEYGDNSKYANGGIPGALRINDRSVVDQVHVSEISGIQDDPDTADSRTERAGFFGERSGNILPRGRTIGLTGFVHSGNVAKMRDLWRRLRAQFGRAEQDLIIHPPKEAPHYVNEVWNGTTTSWTGAMSGATVPASTLVTDVFLNTIQVAATGAPASVNQLILNWSSPIPWTGQDVWMTAVVKAQAAAGTTTSIGLGATFSNSTATWVASGTGIQATPGTTNYYLLTARLTAKNLPAPGATHIIPRVVMTTPATAGAYTLRIGRVSVCLLDPQEASPLGHVGGELPGFEWEGLIGASRSYGPCYTVNQIPDPSGTISTGWLNNSTSGATVDVAGLPDPTWPGDGASSNLWALRNPNTTSRTLSFRSTSGVSAYQQFIIGPNRWYRVHARLWVKESFSQGQVAVVWFSNTGTLISTVVVGNFNSVAPGGTALDVDIDGVLIAPSNAHRGYLQVSSVNASTVTDNRMTVNITETSFFDISEYDPGPVAMDDNQILEHGVPLYSPSRTGTGVLLTPIGARRRIPRPFLIRKIRALWDGKSPGSQKSAQARRDFTMSMRAADPRVYVREERRVHLKLTGTPNAVSEPMTTYSTTLAAAPTQIGYDNFPATTAGNALNGRIPVLGGAWATSGDTGDFLFYDNFQAGDGIESIGRSGPGSAETTGRIALFGPTNYTTSSIQLDSVNFSDNEVSLILRYVDASNYLRVRLPNVQPFPGGVEAWHIETVIAGTATAIVSGNWSRAIQPYRIAMQAYASGRVHARITNLAGTLIYGTLEAFSSTIATGGTLATGRPGLRDRTGGVSGALRNYTNITYGTPPADPGGPPPVSFTNDASSLDGSVYWRNFNWGQAAPLSGVFFGPSENQPPTWLTLSSISRWYYSAGSATYLTPQVTISGNVNNSPTAFNPSNWRVSSTWHYNHIGVILKRVSATTWIEARYNGAHQGQMEATFPGNSPPTSLEIWSSHNTSGTLATTRLDGWDIPYGSVTDGVRKHLRSFMDSTGRVWVELWSTAPNLNDEGLIARQSYLPPAPLLTLYGAGVTGRPGGTVRMARWSDGSSGMNVASIRSSHNVPYLTSFDAVDYAASLIFLTCPVIGDIDSIPLKLELRGGLVAPTISLSSLNSKQSSSIALSGTFTDADPTTIDMDAGTIKTVSGSNQFDRRLLGSRFFSLAPGQNIISIQASTFDANAAAHVIATWRDALR